jgi:hypothetical protein
LFQIVNFNSVNNLKFTYVPLLFQIFSGVIPPDTRNKGEGRGEDGRVGREGRKEGRGGDGMNPRKHILSTALPASSDK